MPAISVINFVHFQKEKESSQQAFDIFIRRSLSLLSHIYLMRLLCTNLSGIVSSNALQMPVISHILLLADHVSLCINIVIFFSYPTPHPHSYVAG